MRRRDRDRVREGILFLEGNYFFPFFGIGDWILGRETRCRVVVGACVEAQVG